MANRGYGYQYETSPRKLEPEYKRNNVKKKKPIQKKTAQKKPVQGNKKKVQNKSKKKFKMSFEVKIFVNSMFLFVVVFAIIACQALVNQRYKEKESLKQQYNELLANRTVGSDLTDEVRVLASEYGMQTKSATLIDLETADYIESSKDEIELESESSFDKFVNWVKKIF